MLEEVNLLQDITMTCREMVGAFVADRTDANGVISSDSFASLARRMGFRAQPWEEAIKARSTLRCSPFLTPSACASLVVAVPARRRPAQPSTPSCLQTVHVPRTA